MRPLAEFVVSFVPPAIQSGHSQIEMADTFHTICEKVGHNSFLLYCSVLRELPLPYPPPEEGTQAGKRMPIPAFARGVGSYR